MALKKYIVKCDVCKKIMRRTDNIVESYQGGVCSNCRSVKKTMAGNTLIMESRHGSIFD